MWASPEAQTLTHFGNSKYFLSPITTKPTHFGASLFGMRTSSVEAQSTACDAEVIITGLSVERTQHS
jgi:hypothetical protein